MPDKQAATQVVADCLLCDAAGPPSTAVWEGEDFYVIQAEEPGFPAFFRLIWNTHVTEFSDLSAAQRTHCVEALVVIEEVLREVLSPTKVNIASLGNQTPHLHWHVVARFDWDSHFPASVWSEATQTIDASKVAAVEAKIPQIKALLVRRLFSLAFS